MRYVCLFVFGIFTGILQAQETDNLSLIQAHADFPNVTIWIDPPANTTLERDQFNISIGQHQAHVFDLDSFQESNEGVGYVFLVDIFKSLRSRQLVHIKRALHHWLGMMGPNDKAALIAFGHDVGHELSFTSDYFKLNNAINMIAITNQEPRLYHALLEAITLGRSRGKGLPERRAIVLLSDGVDDGSPGASMEDVLRLTREYRIPIYSIGFASAPISERKRQGLKNLETLANISGGNFIQSDTHQLDNAYEQQRRRIIQAYRLRADCPDCEANSLLHHVTVDWSDGQRQMSDSVNLRLVPKYISRSSHPHVRQPEDSLSSRFIWTTGLALIIVGLVWLYRHRLQ